MPLLAGQPESEWALLLNSQAKRAARAWSEPAAWQGEAGFGGPPMPAEALGEILIAEFAIHAWDVTVATGQRLEVPESLARTMLDTYAREAPRMRCLGVLADEVAQDAHAPLFERTLALSGRDPEWRSPRARGGRGSNTRSRCPVIRRAPLSGEGADAAPARSPSRPGVLGFGADVSAPHGEAGVTRPWASRRCWFQASWPVPTRKRRLRQLLSAARRMRYYPGPSRTARGQDSWSSPCLLVPAPSSASSCDRSPDLAVPLSVAPAGSLPRP